MIRGETIRLNILLIGITRIQVNKNSMEASSQGAANTAVLPILFYLRQARDTLIIFALSCVNRTGPWTIVEPMSVGSVRYAIAHCRVAPIISPDVAMAIRVRMVTLSRRKLVCRASSTMSTRSWELFGAVREISVSRWQHFQDVRHTRTNASLPARRISGDSATQGLSTSDVRGGAGFAGFQRGVL